MAKQTLEDLAAMSTQRTKINSNFTELYDALQIERFQGKKLLVAGDSITEHNVRATYNWDQYLRDWLGFGSIHNEAVSGSGLIKYNFGNPMVTRVNTWPTDADYIIIMGNMNDGVYTGGAGVPVGAFTDTYPTNETVYAAAKYIIEKCIERIPLAPILWVSSTPRGSSSDLGLDWGKDGWFMTYLNAIKEVCYHYSVPFLDLYNESNLRPFNDDHNLEYFSSPTTPAGDRIHPNEKGQKIIAQKILKKVTQYL